MRPLATFLAISTAYAVSVYAEAQIAGSGNPGDWITVTEYTNDCSTLSGANFTGISYTGTTTSALTNTLPCNECAETTTSTPGIWTTYTTAYINTCSTGLTTKTYTITESCTSSNQPRPSSYVPSGFTVTTVKCSACEQPTVTLTTPCEATTAPSTPKNTPAAPGTTAPPAPPPPPPPPHGPGYVAVNASTLKSAPPAPAPAPTPAPNVPAPGAPAPSAGCHGCGTNSTSPPIHIARASSISSFGSFGIALWTLVGGLVMAL